MKVTRLTTSGSQEKLNVNDALFGVEVNQVLLSQAIRVYLANQRQGTAKVKTRSEINRTKKKWFKQKGTGNARHGARTPSIFVGGGVSHGPTGIQDWSLSLPPRMKHQALVSALSAQAENVVIADGLSTLKGKTAQAVKLLAPIADPNKRILVIMDAYNEDMLKSLRNLPQVLVMTAGRVTALEVAVADTIVTSEAAIAVLEARLLSAAKPAPKVKTAAAPTVEATTVEKKTSPAKKAAAKPAAAPKTAKVTAKKTSATKKVAKK